MTDRYAAHIFLEIDPDEIAAPETDGIEQVLAKLQSGPLSRDQAETLVDHYNDPGAEELRLEVREYDPSEGIDASSNAKDTSDTETASSTVETDHETVSEFDWYDRVKSSFGSSDDTVVAFDGRPGVICGYGHLSQSELDNMRTAGWEVWKLWNPGKIAGIDDPVLEFGPVED